MVGGAAAEGALAFGVVSGLAVSPDSTIAVADAAAGHIVLISAGGELIATLGGRGQGPGEFEALDGVAFDAGGRLWARDRSLGRIAVFGADLDGGVETHRTPFPPRLVPWRPVFLDGRYLDWELDRDSLRYGVSAFRLREVLPTPRVVDRLRLEEDLIPGSLLRRPYGADLEFAVDGSGALWWARTDQTVVVRRPIGGGSVQSTALPLSLERVDPEEAERMARGWSTTFHVSPNEVAPHHPAILRLIVDPRGGVAVLARSPEHAFGQVLLRFEDGAARAYELPLRLESNPAPVLNGSTLVGVSRDPSDAARIVSLGLRAS